MRILYFMHCKKNQTRHYWVTLTHAIFCKAYIHMHINLYSAKNRENESEVAPLVAAAY